ncbi:MAG: MlaD family protein [Fibrobacter sp.]|jgi:phospholipid/cholesterol/gamma-HCH transport system substrate-binding protein|nr:MlaD family protein [Fibrobacter sp.]
MKKNTSLYFAVGLVVILAIVVLIFGMFFLNDKDPREKFNTFFLRFVQVSTLTIDDPVKVNGVKLGKVEDIYLSGNRVMVKIRVRDDVKIPKNSEIRVQNIGIMGERQIGVILGDSAVYFAPQDTIPGHFDAGIAEALGVAGAVLDSTKFLVQSIRQVMDSTIAHPHFTTQFKTILAKAENLEDRLLNVIQDTDPRLRKSLIGLQTATEKVNTLLDTMPSPLFSLIDSSKATLQNANQVVTKLDATMQQLASIMGKLQSEDNTAGILLNDRKFYDELNTTIHSADSLFRVILEDGLDINVDFF